MEKTSIREKEEIGKKEDDKMEKKLIIRKVVEKEKEEQEDNLLIELIKISSPRIKEELFKKELIKLLKEKASSFSYPDYIKASWIRIPPHKKYLKAWREKWYPVILAYASSKLLLKIDISKILTEWPFSDGSTTIPENELKEILKEMEKRGLAIRFSDYEALVLWIKPKELAEIFLKVALKVGVSVIRTSVLLDVFKDLGWSGLIYLLKIIEKIGYGSIIMNGLGFKIGR